MIAAAPDAGHNGSSKGEDDKWVMQLAHDALAVSRTVATRCPPLDGHVSFVRNSVLAFRPMHVRDRPGSAP